MGAVRPSSTLGGPTERRDAVSHLSGLCRDENGGVMFYEQLASKTASRWLARAVGRQREAKPTLGGPTMFNEKKKKSCQKVNLNWLRKEPGKIRKEKS